MAQADEGAAVEKKPEGSEQAGVETKGSDAPKSPEIDYRAEAEKLRVERDNYKRAFLQKKEFVRKGAQDTGEEDAGVDNTDEVADKVVQRLAPMFTRNAVDEELRRLTSNPDEQDLIREHYEYSINKTGLDPTSVRRDLEKARVLANAPRIISERNEAARAAANAKKPDPLAGGGTGSEREQKPREHGWTADQVKEMNKLHLAATGKPMTDEQIKKAWENFQKRKQAVA